MRFEHLPWARYVAIAAFLGAACGPVERTKGNPIPATPTADGSDPVSSNTCPPGRRAFGAQRVLTNGGCFPTDPSSWGEGVAVGCYPETVQTRVPAVTCFEGSDGSLFGAENTVDSLELFPGYRACSVPNCAP